MPCYTVQTASVELNNVDHATLAKAMEKIGYTVMRSGKNFTFRKGGVSGSYQNNKLNMQSTGGARMDGDAIKRSVSEQIIADKAAEYAEQGWEMTQDGDEYVFTKTPGYGAVFA
jgi:hypothetical protein